MLAAGDLPAIGNDRNQLGLRAGEATLSAFLDPARIYQPIRPATVSNQFGAPGDNHENALFAILEADLAAVGLRPGKPHPRTTHVPIEAAEACDAAEYARRLTATQGKWRKV